MKVKVILAATMVAAAGTFAYAQADVIAQRQALMKSNGASAGALSAMVQGNSPFDAAAAKAALKTIAKNMATFPTLFPEGSDVGDTRAGPAIWTDMAGFKARAAKLAADASAAAASATSLNALKTSFGTVASNCGGCHSNYRK